MIQNTKALSNTRRLATVIVDASTEKPIEGVPSADMFKVTRLGATVLATLQDGEWSLVADGDLGWRMRQGHVVQAIRMVRPAGPEIDRELAAYLADAS